MLLILASWPHFRLLFWAFIMTIDLIVEGVILTRVVVAINLSGFYLWKVLLSL